MKDLFSRAEKYLARARRRRLWLRLVSLLSCAVLLFTTYAQILPAITMEASEFEPDGHVHTDACYKTVVTEEKTELDCPLELHTHTAACYDAGGDLVCGYADFVVHTHDRYCYDEKGRLVCTLPEIEEHTHTAQCWLLAKDAASDAPAAAPHVHTEECYTVLAGELLCEQEETDGHVHDESCYTETEELVCGLEEDEGHTHTDLCMDTEGLPELCGQEEREGHAHDESCYETVEELTCGQEEAEPHRHTEECYAQEKELTCGLEEGTGTAAEPAAPADEDEEQQEPICGLEEVELHTHTAACLDADGVPTCGQPEVLAHQHTEECFRVVQEASEEKVLDCPYSASGEPEKDKDDTEKEPGGDDAGDTDEKPDEGDGDTAEDPAPDGETPEEPTPAERLLEAVQSHIGEGESKDDFEEDEAGETHGATVFGAYYGLPYDKWDAMFLAYCMEEAGIKELPSAEECMFDIDLWAAMLASEGIYRMAGRYTPAPGDILFLDMDGDATADAVAVAEKWTDGRLTVIAGDSNDRVRRVSYDADEESILGYAQLAEGAGADGPLPDEEDVPGEGGSLPDEDGTEQGGDVPDADEDKTGGGDMDGGQPGTGSGGKEPGTEDETPDAGSGEDMGPEKGEKPDKTPDEGNTAGGGAKPAPAQSLSARVLAAATEQLGYVAAEDGTTLFGEFYGQPDAPWNLLFAAYCVEQSGAEELPLAGGSGFDCDLWLTALSGAGLYREAGLYTPAPGDLVFLDRDADGAADRVAVVENVEQDRLNAIEGDVFGCVRRVSYALDEARLMGYVQIEEKDTDDAAGEDGDEEGAADGEKLYQTTKDSAVQAMVLFAAGSKMPADAVLTVSPVAETQLLSGEGAENSGADYGLLKKQAEEAVGKQAAQFVLYDISFYTPENEYIPVAETATVSLRMEDAAFKDAAQIAVLHYPADQEDPVVLEAVAWETEEDGAATVTFETDGFSMFGVMELGDGDEADAQELASSFKLTYGGHTITFNLVDSAGDALNAEKNDITGQAATQYIFSELAPAIDGYTYSYAVYDNVTVASVGTTGFKPGFNDSSFTSTFQIYEHDPIQPGQWYSKSEDCTIKLVYTRNAGSFNNFRLTYGGYAVTFALVDSEGNELKATVNDETAERAKQYKFSELAPEISGYTYSHASYGNNTVVSVGTTGFDNGYSAVSKDYMFQIYIHDPIQERQWYSASAGCTIKLVYTRNSDNFDGQAFVIVNHRSEGDYALTASTAGSIYGVEGLASQLVTLIQNSEGDYQAFYDATMQIPTVWSFHRQSDGTYTISTSEERYLQLCKTLSPSSEGCGSLTLTDSENASHVTVEAGENGSVTLKYDGSYISLEPNSNNFWCSNEKNANAEQYLCELTSAPASIITTGVNHPSSIINLFDYWLEEQKTPDDSFTVDQLEKGINQGHALKFIKNADGVKDDQGNQAAIADWNKWTGRSETLGGIVYPGIVENQLGADGYPVLTTKIDSGQESLAYLFDPETQNAYRADYCNVGGLLQVNDEGFYSYNSQSNFAEYDELNNRFILYGRWGVRAGGSSPNGQFFPFNSMEKVKDVKSDTAAINHYFGLTLTTRFAQQYGGYTTSTHQTRTIFNFSGDDDVWIFIDDVLVADLGGNHDAVEVMIDFSTGYIVINNNSAHGSTATLRSKFEEALGAENLDLSQWNGNTFADNTYHVLKFFYLERGNTDSNLYLKYNLTEIPATSIYKVNQYGKAIPGAKFEVFPSNEGYTNTSEVSVYSGITDNKGEMVFTGADGMPYTLDEMKELFGEYFVLKETEAPASYRLVSEEIHLHIQNGLLLCENTYESGVWAAPSLQIAAPAQLTLKTAGGDVSKEYYGLSNGKSDGTLFAVVLKYIGSGAEGLTSQENWVPVSGTSKIGYTTHDVSGDFIDAVIEAAKAQIELRRESSVCFALAASGAMQLTMEDLPGDIRTYYHLLDQNNKGDTKYTIGYYWTEANSVSGATSNNTWRVDAEKDAFDRAFGATIEVPNLFNTLFAQKLNEQNELVNGASFALYKVEEKDNSIYYVADDETLIFLDSNQGKAVVDDSDGYTYIIDSSTGVITVTGSTEPYTITPYKTAKTQGADAHANPSKEDGTATFTGIKDGTYYLREVGVPKGYYLNPAEVMVLVVDDAIYANAGTENDNIRVARGPGYLVSTLSKFASQGAIDNTLSWVYAQMRVSDESTTFTAYQDGAWKDWKYLETGNGERQTTYLEYDPNSSNTLFNYTVNRRRYTDSGSVNRRLYTDVGWSYYELYQDYIYGKEHIGTADYTKVVDAEGNILEIANLFSRSTYIQVTDKKYDGTLKISKMLEGVSDKEDCTFEFDVTLTNDEPEGRTYTYTIYDIKIEEGKTTYTPAEVEKDDDGNETTYTLNKNGGTIHLKSSQVAVITEIPAGTEYTVKESDTSADGYMVSSIRDQDKDAVGSGMGEARFAQVATGTLYWAVEADGTLDTTSTVEFTNTRLTELTIHKVDSTGRFSLSGAEFVLYRINDNRQKEYYSYTSDGAAWNPLADADAETEKDYALETNEKGMVLLGGVQDGSYCLEEISPPDGYYPLTEPICFTVSGGKITEVSYGEDKSVQSWIKGDGLLLEIPNSTGYKLPQTGGSGSLAYTLAGAVLLMGAAVGFAVRRRKEEEEK